METRVRQWRQWRASMVVYLVMLYIWMDLHGSLNEAYQYANETQVTLCQAQCEALCLDKIPTCETDCNGPTRWYSTCDDPVCAGTCSVLKKSFDDNHDKLPIVPKLNISLSGFRGVELSWQHSKFSSNLTTIYIIEESRPIPYMTQISSYKIVGWVRDNKYRIHGFEACSPNSYRIMAINRYGSSGFSDSAKSIGLRPGQVTNIHYAGSGVYFKQEEDPTVSRFMTILQWDEPLGWRSDEIQHYEWNPMTPHHCQEISQNSLPLFQRMENQTKHILLTIAAMSIGCTFTTQVRAVSTCNVTGPWTDFVVDLTDCNKIIGYKCQDLPFDPPGQVDNVSLTISATPLSVIMKWFTQPFTINPSTTSPLLINLHVRWDEPSDLGSKKIIDKYIIRSGPVKKIMFFPPTFTEPPSIKNLSGNIRELIFQLPTSKIPYTYGVQIVAVAPDEVIPDNQWGILSMYTIKVARNDSLAELRKEGKILLDDGGIVIVFINNTLPIIILDHEVGKASNNSVTHYALQWGPLVGPNSNKMLVENKTIVPLETTVLVLPLKHPHRRYGIKIRGLTDDQEDPDEHVWDEVPTLTFSLDDIDIDEEKHRSTVNILTPLYVVAPIVLGCICLAMFLRHHRKQRTFKHLERRLAMADDSDVDSENGDHYFIMRTAGIRNPGVEDEQISTVVTDRWELPHACIKVGRVLGSGAFGQVVKGRVSRSVLQSRGIDLHAQRAAGQGMHVTVAVKMLQECPEERYSADFLREIQMMKDIGYHRNIVSMLGCCTLREPYCLIVEHVANGDLLTYLRKIRTNVEQRAEEVGSYVNQEVEMFSPHTLLSYARQIVTGMEYLSQKGFVHRDLAARNILVGDNSTVKIADFGLARYIYYDVGKVYVNRNGGKLPVKWMAPESIFDQIFSTASDVWSFGILLFEIVTLGAMPYPQLSHTDLVNSLRQGYSMEKPHNCSEELYDIMKHCWSYNPGSRPSFTRLKEIFTFLLEEDSGQDYFDFKVHEDRLYYRINSDELDISSGDAEGSADGYDTDSEVQAEKNHDLLLHRQTQLAHHQVIFQLENENITIQDMPKPSKNKESDKDPLNKETGYTDDAFKRSASTTSSFHNELYSGMEDETIVGMLPNPSNPKISDDVEEEVDQDVGTDLTMKPVRFAVDVDADNLSGVSDDVFEECHDCNNKQISAGQENEAIPCEVCKFDLQINDFDIHVSERNDSAIGSDNSSGRYHTDSSNSSVNSNEYLMPDSPLSNAIENDYDLLPDLPYSSNCLSRQLSVEKYPRIVYDYHFINLHREDDANAINKDLIVPGANDTYADYYRAQGLPITITGNQNGKSEIDIWSIAETKM